MQIKIENNQTYSPITLQRTHGADLVSSVKQLSEDDDANVGNEVESNESEAYFSVVYRMIINQDDGALEGVEVDINNYLARLQNEGFNAQDPNELGNAALLLRHISYELGSATTILVGGRYSVMDVFTAAGTKYAPLITYFRDNPENLRKTMRLISRLKENVKKTDDLLVVLQKMLDNFGPSVLLQSAKRHDYFPTVPESDFMNAINLAVRQRNKAGNAMRAIDSDFMVIAESMNASLTEIAKVLRYTF